MPRVRVEYGRPAPRRATEHSFEQDVIRGRMTEKTDGIEGFPDRYFGKGRWIEFKSDTFSSGISPYNRLRRGQAVKMGVLYQMGDDPWVCMLLLDAQTGNEHVLFMPFVEFRLKFKGKPRIGRRELIDTTHSKEFFLAKVWPSWAT